MTALNVLSSRQIRERERSRLFALVAMVVVAVAIALNLTAPPSPPSPTLPAPASTGTDPASSTFEAQQVTKVGRAFVTGYLAHLYGRAPARQIPSTTAALRRRLSVQRLVGAASRGRPRIAGVSARQLGRRWLVRALVADRTRVSFAVEVVVVRLGGRLVVVRVVGD